MSKTHTLAVFIGRFQPFHVGHLEVVKSALTEADSLLVLVGSSYRPRSWKNPFTYNERVTFIRDATSKILKPIATLPLVDTLYNDRAWTTNVRTAVTLHMRKVGLDPDETEILLVGLEKDKSSQYLNWFPAWSLKSLPATTHDAAVISATDLREGLFFGEDQTAAGLGARFGAAQVATVQSWMEKMPAAVDTIRKEGAFVRNYHNRIAAAEKVYGYPIPINTVDAVVIQSGHILMVERKMEPGKGLWALPGGHIDPEETAEDACVRELYEEAGLDMPKGAMRGRLRARRVFDHPDRSERGWVRTEAFVFELQDRKALEKLKAGDDAANAVGCRSQKSRRTLYSRITSTSFKPSSQMYPLLIRPY